MKFKIGFEENINKRYEIILEAPEGTTREEMDDLCCKMENNEFATHAIEEIEISKYKINETIEGAENGEIEVDELDEA